MSAQGYTITILTNSSGSAVFNNGLLSTLVLKEVHPDTGNLLTNTYPALAFLGDGTYSFGNVPYASYKLFNGASEVTKFHGTSGKGKWIGASSYAASIIDSGTLDVSRLPDGIPTTKIGSGDVGDDELDALIGIEDNIQNQLDGKTNTTGGASPIGQWEFNPYPKVDDAIESPTHARHLTTKDYVDTADDLALHKAENETITGAKLVKANFIIDTANGGLLKQSFYSAPTESTQYVAKKYVDDRISSYLSGLEVPLWQQSSRTLRVLYDGATESNRVFTSISLATAHAAAQTPSVDKQYFILVEQSGLDSGIGSQSTLYAVEDFVHLIGQDMNTVIYGNDDSFTAGALGRVLIKDCTLMWVGDSKAPSFTNVKFENVTFDIADNTLDFTTCDFQNCKVKRGAGTWTINNCYGSPIITDIYPTITGYSPKIYIDGQYNQRNLGVKGTDIASNTSITLGTTGNFFNISGNTDIENISTTGWTNGSVIMLRGASGSNFGLIHGGVLTSGKLALSSASNITVDQYTTVALVLDGSTWYELSHSTNN